MRALVVILILSLAVPVGAEDDLDDDPGDPMPSGKAAARRLKAIDDEIQLEAIDPEETPEEPDDLDDPFADDPDADDTLPEDRPDHDPDAAPPILEPADTADAVEIPPRKSNFPKVLESPLKRSPLDPDPE